MLRFVVLTTLIATACAYGGGYSTGGGYGGGSASLIGLGGLKGFGSSVLTQGYGQQLQLNSGYGGGLIPAAVQSRRSVQFYDVPSTLSNAAPLTIDVPANQQPVNFVFRSASSPLNLESLHQSSQGSFEETSSQDEPHVRVHTVTRPVVQKVNEIIAPYRQITQQVQPVQEDVQALIAKGNYQQQQQVQLVQKPLLLQKQLLLQQKPLLQIQKPLFQVQQGYSKSGGY